MDRALRLACENVRNGRGGPFGCLIVKEEEGMVVVVSEAVNSVTNDNDPTAHAEMNAIRRACKVLQTIDLEGCIAYSSCEPCSMCYSALKWAKVDRIVFCNTREEADAIGFRDERIYDEIIQGRQEMERFVVPDALRAFVAWQGSTHKVSY